MLVVYLGASSIGAKYARLITAERKERPRFANDRRVNNATDC